MYFKCLVMAIIKAKQFLNPTTINKVMARKGMRKDGQTADNTAAICSPIIF